MNDEQIDFLITNLSSAVVFVITNKSTIFITVVALYILRRILTPIYRRLQFPVFTAKPAGKTLYCAVCLHDVDGGQRYRRLPGCRHCFHVNCIDIWLQSRSTCPLCRYQIPVHLLPRQEQQQPGFLYMFFYFSMKAVRKKIESKFTKIMMFEAS